MSFSNPMHHEPRLVFPIVLQRGVKHSTLLRLQRKPEQFLQWCKLRTLLKPNDRTSHSWEDPIDGTPLEMHQYLIGDWACRFIIERGEISEWGIRPINEE